VNCLPRSKNPFAELPTEPTASPDQPIELPNIEAAATVAVPADFFTKLLTTFAEKMNEGIRERVKAAREVPIDPIKEAQKIRAAKTKKEAEEGYWRQLVSRFEQCNHLREDLTCCVSWAIQSDGKQRGYCSHCGVVFSPVRNECASQAIFDKYKEIIRIPCSKGSSVNYV
jgi:hypothetical protein